MKKLFTFLMIALVAFSVNAASGDVTTVYNVMLGN